MKLNNLSPLQKPQKNRRSRQKVPTKNQSQNKRMKLNNPSPLQKPQKKRRSRQKVPTKDQSQNKRMKLNNQSPLQKPVMMLRKLKMGPCLLTRSMVMRQKHRI
jgi:hypothetical protein